MLVQHAYIVIRLHRKKITCVREIRKSFVYSIYSKSFFNGHYAFGIALCWVLVIKIRFLLQIYHSLARQICKRSIFFFFLLCRSTLPLFINIFILSSKFVEEIKSLLQLPNLNFAKSISVLLLYVIFLCPPST